MRRWLVTGGCGFIGRNLISRLLNDPKVIVRVIDDLSVGRREELNALYPIGDERGDNDAGWNYQRRLTLVVGDIRNENTAYRVAEGADVVVHLAGNTGVSSSINDPRSDCLSNVIGTMNYLEACRRHNISRFVFASSGASIGDCVPPLHEELAARPVSPYGASKLSGEAYCSAYNRSFGIETVALRFGNCYGPLSSHKGSVVAKFIREALTGVPWEIYGGGEQTRDFIFVDDVVEAVLLAARTAAIGGEVFQIATSAETTVLELANVLSRILEQRGATAVVMRHSAPRVGDVLRNYSDTRKAKSMLGWSAQVPLEEGLKRTVDWFLQMQMATSGRYGKTEEGAIR
jgi:UDP-glucose 4-epimerase